VGHIFLSHVEEDFDVVEQLAQGLESGGYEVWFYERDSVPGRSYLLQTGEAIERCAAFLIVISAKALGSQQVTKEVVRAHEHGKSFIPVLRGLTHAEFQARQPEWREAIGAAASITLPGANVENTLPAILAGLAALEVPKSGSAQSSERKTPNTVSVGHSGEKSNLPRRNRLGLWSAVALLVVTPSLFGIWSLLRSDKEPASAEPPRLPAPIGSQPISSQEPKRIQAAWAKFLHREVVEDNTIRAAMVLIPPGSFQMGSDLTVDQFARNGIVMPPGLDIQDERPQRTVEIARPFLLSAHEVTVAQFRRFVDASDYQTDAETDGKGGWGIHQGNTFSEPSPRFSWRNTGAWPQSDNRPVINVSHRDALSFCQWLSKVEGKSYELPTEAEWEYACRAGTNSTFASGNTAASLDGYANALGSELKELNMFREVLRESQPFPFNDHEPFSAPVGSYSPNAFGLYDMHGNVFEWCADAYQSPTSVKKQAEEIAPDSPPSKDYVARGGSWMSAPAYARAAFRLYESGCDAQIGFRIVCRIDSKPK
jgi:formylglycine-generating enzyme required for sulfatase activity